MTLPLHLQMEIDIHAQMHSRDIAEAFAKLRAKLPPDPAQSLAKLQALLMNAAWNPSAQQMMLSNAFPYSQMQSIWPQPAFGNAAPSSEWDLGLFGRFP